MNGYLIPANSKKSMLKLGLFTTLDLVLFGCGIGLTVLLLFIVPAKGLVGMGLILLPALISGFLVFPIANYHNVLQLIINIYTFFFVRQRTYVWKGWCYKDGNVK